MVYQRWTAWRPSSNAMAGLADVGCEHGFQRAPTDVQWVPTRSVEEQESMSTDMPARQRYHHRYLGRDQAPAREKCERGALTIT